MGNVRNEQTGLTDGTVAHHHALDRLHRHGLCVLYVERGRVLGWRRFEWGQRGSYSTAVTLTEKEKLRKMRSWTETGVTYLYWTKKMKKKRTDFFWLARTNPNAKKEDERKTTEHTFPKRVFAHVKRHSAQAESSHSYHPHIPDS